MAGTNSDLTQAEVETRVRTWSLEDEAEAAVDPTDIVFTARPVGGADDGTDDTTWGTSGSGETYETVTDDDDGTGTWTIAAGELAVGTYRWWALATTATEVRIPTGMTGKLTITDR